MKKTVLVIQNFEGTSLGQVGRILEETGIGTETVLAFDGQPLPVDHGAHDGLVMLGGGQDALDDTGSPWFPDLLRLTGGFVATGKPVLGICLGAQLLARALGARNHVGGHSEFGWQPIALTAGAAEDPVLGTLPSGFRSFQWHDDHFDLPAGAVRLASSTTAANQAFRFADSAYGFQFHFEADRALVREWNREFSDYLADRQPDWLSRHAVEEESHGAAADEIGAAIARGWAGLLR